MLKTDEQTREERSERIKQAIAKSGLKKSDIARACDVSPQALTGWLKTGRISKESLAIIARVSGVDLDWLITGKSEKLNPAFISLIAAAMPKDLKSNLEPAPRLTGMSPLVSWVQAGAFSESIASTIDDHTKYYPRPDNASDQTFVLRVSGESMIDEYKPGTLIFVDPERPAKNGDDIVIAMEGRDEVTFKRYIEDPIAGKMLKALNSTWPNQFIQIGSTCRIVGVVVADMRIR